MSIASEISRLQDAKADLKTAIEGKGVTVPASATLDDYALLVSSIDGGGGGGGDPDTPTGYTRLKYLESSGTQIIDTGKWLKLSSKVVCDCHYLAENQGGYAYMFGCSNPPLSPMVVNNVQYPSSTNPYWSFGDKTDIRTSPAALVFVRGLLTIDKNTGTFEYNSYSPSVPTSTINATSVTENQNSHICLFGRQNNGSYGSFAKCRIYEYWYYENDVLLQHMIPLKRNSDDVLGMYDLESNTFYTNVGTGDFIGM